MILRAECTETIENDEKEEKKDFGSMKLHFQTLCVYLVVHILEFYNLVNSAQVSQSGGTKNA